MNPLLEVDRVVVKRGNGSARKTILDSISFAIEPGSWTDIEGKSGCGKSTLLETLARFLPLESGHLKLKGVHADQIPAISWRAAAALIRQRPTALPGTVMDNLLAGFQIAIRKGQSAPDHDRLTQELHNLGLGELSLQDSAAALSVGQIARIGILRTLLTEPLLLLLDEPTANLDQASSKLMLERIAEFQKAGGAVIRVRHHAPDNLAQTTFEMENSRLREVCTA